MSEQVAEYVEETNQVEEPQVEEQEPAEPAEQEPEASADDPLQDKSDRRYKRLADGYKAERERAEKLAQEAAFYRELALKGQQPQPEQVQPQAARGGAPVPPDPAAFDAGMFDPAYQEAQREFIEQTIEYRTRTAIEQREVEASNRARAKELDDQERAFREHNPDYDVARDNLARAVNLQQNPVLAQALLNSGKAVELVYVLGQHPEAAQQLASMPPVKIAMEVGRLVAAIEGAAQPADKPRVNAPPQPISPLSGHQPASKLSMSNYGGDYEAFKRMREAQQKKRG